MVDKLGFFVYNGRNSIGQFVTILSVNKTTDLDGRFAPIFLLRGTYMNQRVRNMVYAAVIAALYATLTHMQNILLPGSATMAIQFRASEALCVLAFFTPAAIPGLAVGCLVFNLTFANALPLDFLVGSLASLLAAWGMWLSRKITVKGLPVLGLTLPAISNALLVGWELSVYIGGGFWLNALYVAIGELAVLLTLGSALCCALKSRGLDQSLFG